MPEILGDATRIGALELKVRALSINNDALTNAVKTMRQTVRELKHAADNADMKEKPSFAGDELPGCMDGEYPDCSVDVLCLLAGEGEDNPVWDVGYYNYTMKEWSYNSLPTEDYNAAPIRWEFLPE